MCSSQVYMSGPIGFLVLGAAFFGARAILRGSKNVNWAPFMESFSGATTGFKNSMNKLSIIRQDRAGFDNPMSIKEAYQILNINPTANKDDIRLAHRTLMLRNHPDNGGSNFVASKINEAKTLLSGGK